MSENLITWNIQNWITVVVMGVLGFLLIGLAGNLLRSARAEAGA